MSDSNCCCHALGERCPISNASEHVHRCRPRAMDMGHCTPPDATEGWCCGIVGEMPDGND